MSLTYTTYISALQNLAVVPADNSDTSFQDIIPDIIDYAEQRIYRELDFLCTWVSQTTTATANNRNVTMPSAVIVCQSLNVITPYTTTNPDAGTRNPLNRRSIDYINAMWSSSVNPTVPVDYAIIGTPTVGATTTAGSYAILLGPFPDQAYTLELIGTVRPSPISPANATTFISLQMPDLFIAASMVFIAGYQRDFGQQSGDPQLGQSWENQYQSLKASLNYEELRRKAASASWSPFLPTPQANEQRDRANAAPQT